MAGVSWVGGTVGVMGSGTAITATTPSGIQDGDALLAWVTARSTVTPPAGWSLVTSVPVTASSITQTLHLYRKDTVTSGNASTAYTFNQTSSLTYGICYQVVRAESGVVVLRDASTATSTGSTTVTPAAVTADRGQEMTLIGAGCILQTTSTYLPTPPTGFTLSSSNPTNNRCMACYRQTNTDYVNSGTFLLSASSSNQGNNAITVRATDQEEAIFVEELTELTEDYDMSGSTYGYEFIEGLGAHALLGILYQDELADGVSAADTAAQIQPLLGVLSEALQVIAAAPTGAWAKAASETLGLNASETSSPGVVLRVGLGIDDPIICNQKVGMLLAEELEATAAILAGRPLTLTEALDLALTVQAAAAVTVAQDLGIAASLLPTATYNLTVSQGLGVAGALSRFLGGAIAETLYLEQSDAEQMRFVEALEDGLGIDETVTPYFILKVTASDAIGFDASEALQQIFNGQIAEGLELSGAYIGPDGSFTTWAMNTRTGAVSEYENYAFNSFARVGNKYLGASSSGLYELLGDNDDGDDIVATLRGGYLQFAGTRLSRLKAAYIAMTGEDQAILKLETKDGATYTYQIDTRDGRSSKVHMGKGQRSRYFAWELTTVGQDFDLDTLEFVPVRVDRRV